MNERHLWANLVFGNVTLAVATVTLAAISTVSSNDRPWIWIIASSAVFIIIHAAVNTIRDKSIVRRLGRNYDRIQRRGVQVIADLGQLAGDQFDLWMIDLYLPNFEWSFNSQWPLLQRNRVLSRQLAVSLIDMRPQPPSVDSVSSPHWLSFENTQPLIWFNKDIHTSNDDNAWDTLDEATNAELAKDYGVLSIYPLVDQLGKDCVGVLTIHVEPEGNSVLKALGVLQSTLGRHRLTNTCVELNGLLAR